jgi:hypothetical protein
MQQSNLVPILCNRTAPAPQSADAEFIAISDQLGKQFLCKGQKQHPMHPAIEWICSSLARDCRLPVPNFSVVEVAQYPGVLMFGSEWVNGCVDYVSAISNIKNYQVFNEVLELDFFAHNVDRHYGNYLYMKKDDGFDIGLVDFSRAMLYHGWPLPLLPFKHTDNTIIYFNDWKGRYGYLKSANIINKISAMSSSWMSDIISGMPPAWLDDTTKENLVNWWSCVNTHDSRISRLNMTKLTLP